MHTDPIVEEIHEIRRQIAAEHGNDIQRIGAYFMALHQTRARGLTSHPPHHQDGGVSSAALTGSAVGP